MIAVLTGAPRLDIPPHPLTPSPPVLLWLPVLLSQSSADA